MKQGSFLRGGLVRPAWAFAFVLLMAVQTAAFAQPRAFAQTDEWRFSPVVISFVPGISMPPGESYSTNLGIGMIMSEVRNLYGVQGAPIMTIAGGDVLGIQASGIGAIAEGAVTGFQSGGIFNVAAGRVVGGQFGGVFNVANDDLMGVQSGGVFNVAEGNVFPVQAAGVFNVAEGSVRGLQIGGVFNVAEDVTGGQIAGIMNTADTVRGVQIGLINISNRMYGVPIGLINIVREGISTPAVWFDDAGRSWASFQRGSNVFYGVAYAGGPAERVFVESSVFDLGLGGGFRIGAAPEHRLFLDMDASVKTRIRSASFAEDLEQGSFTATPVVRGLLGMRFLGRLSLIGGVHADVGFDASHMQSFTVQTERVEASLQFAGMEFYPSYFIGIAWK